MSQKKVKTLVKCKSKSFSTLVHLELVSCDVLDKTKTNLDQLCEVFVLIRILTISWIFDKGVLYVKRTVGVLKVLKVSRTNQE